jgi:hypothetical protein
MTVFTIETLAALAARLFDHSEDLAATLEFELVVSDVRLAARAISNMATLRFRIGEIAEAALSQDGAATRRDLIEALADATASSL